MKENCERLMDKLEKVSVTPPSDMAPPLSLQTHTLSLTPTPLHSRALKKKKQDINRLSIPAPIFVKED